MRNYPHWLKAYLDYTRASEAPSTLHFWTGVWTIAAAVRRRIWRDEFYFQWTPNFYIVLVGPAGVVQKSTTINLGRDLVYSVPGVHFGQDSGSWQGLGDSLADSTEYFKFRNGSGVEETQSMSALSIAASELGTFLSPEDEHQISFLTDMWDGRSKPYKHRTKHAGKIDIENPWINMIGATTPAWIQRNVKPNMIGEGLLSRTIFVYAERKRQLVSLPSRLVSQQDHEARKKLTEDLVHISKLCGPYEFEDSVYADGGWMDSWYAKHNTVRAPHMASDRYGGYISRKQTHLVKLAMVIAVSKRDDALIMEQDLIEADALLVDSEHSMLQVFESIGIVEEAKHIAEITAFVRAYGELEINQLYTFCHNIMEKRVFIQNLHNAIDGKLLEKFSKNGEVFIRVRPRAVN